jgi:uncharacterized protein
MDQIKIEKVEEEIKSRLSIDLKSAMKDRNAVAIKAIRSLMSAIDNAGAVSVEAPKIMPMSGGIAGATAGLGSTEIPRRDLSAEDIKQIIRKEIDEMAKAIESINDHSRPETVQLERQIDLLRGYL